jgi:Holliday junction resolvase
MNPIKSPKNKGSGFERDLVNLLNEKIKDGVFKRIAGSGAMGTAMGEPLLTADVKGEVKGFSRPFKIECKVGYGGATQLTLKKEWINKVMKEALGNYSIPVLIGKFSGARKTDGVQEFAVLDIDTFIYMLNLVSDLTKELDIVYDTLAKDRKV